MANLYNPKFQQVVILKGVSFYIISQVNCQNIRKNIWSINIPKGNKNILSM